MSEFVYWPYDEVSIVLNESQVHVHAPWMSASLPINPSSRQAILQLSEKIDRQTLEATDIALIQWFFAPFKDYPFCYILPQPKAGHDRHVLVDRRLVEHGTLHGFFDAVVSADLRSELGISDDEAHAIKKSFGRIDFNWDADAAAAFAQTHGSIHPESIFSVARRFHILELLENPAANQAFAYIKRLKANEFRRASAMLIRQNHYVTQHCQAALAPAQITGQGAGPKVAAFMAEELGHDRILGAAVRSLSEDNQELPVSAHTKLLMAMLRFCAQRNFLAFAMVVDAFERSSYQDQDPMAKLVGDAGFKQAAKQINHHMEINDDGGHENLACGFLSRMLPCDAGYATEALRLAEITTLIMNAVASSAIELFQIEQGRPQAHSRIQA